MRQLVVQMARLGDLVQTLPLVGALSRHGEVDLVCAFEPGERLRAAFSKVFVLPLDEMACVTDDPHKLIRWTRSRLTQPGDGESVPRYQRVYCMNEAAPALALARLLGRGNWRGAGAAGDPYTRWLHALVRERRQALLPLVEVMQVLADEPQAPEAERTPGAGPILVHPGSGDVARQLPDAFWVNLLRELLKMNPDRALRLTGNQAEQERCQRLAAAISSERVRNLAGKLNLDDLQGELDQASLLIAQDTGVLHLAAWCRTPLLGLYHGSMYAQQTGPWLENALVLEVLRECHPCIEGHPACGDYACTGDFNAHETAAVAEAKLRGSDLPDPSCGRLLRMRRVDRGLVALDANNPQQTVLEEQQNQRRALYQRSGVEALLQSHPALLARASEGRTTHAELCLWRGRPQISGFIGSWDWLVERDTLEGFGR